MRNPFVIAVLTASLAFAAPAAQALGPTSTEPAALPAGEWLVDKSHVSVVARVMHMGFSHYTVRFGKVDARFTYDPKSPADAKVTATIEAASLDTGAPSLDGQFATQFLDAEKAPEISFVSTRVVPGEGNHGTLTGDLTLRGQTHPVTLEVTFNGVGSGLNPLAKRAGFSAHGVIRRSDFGSTFLLSPAIVGDEVEIIIEAEFARQ